MFVSTNVAVVGKRKYKEQIMANQEKKSLKEFLRVVKFTLISISAGIIQVGVYALIRLIIADYFPEESWQDYVLAYAPSLILSVVWNFTINRKYTFKSANNIKIAMLLVFAFYAVFTPVSIILGALATSSGANDDLVFVLTLLSNFVLEFLYTRFVVYRNSVDTAVKAEENQVKSDNE